MPPVSEEHHGAPARAVRSFLLTSGRTKPVVDLPVEATLRLSEAGHREWPDSPLGRVAAACDGRSVAEVCAATGMPVGVVRVLLADLVTQGFADVQQTLSGDAPDDARRTLIERTLSGLRNL